MSQYVVLDRNERHEPTKVVMVDHPHFTEVSGNADPGYYCSDCGAWNHYGVNCPCWEARR